MRAFAIAFGVLCALGVSIAMADYIAMDFGCDTTEQQQKANACRGECKKTADAAEATCNETYKTCAKACVTGETFSECRKKCRESYDPCLKAARDTLATCGKACVLDNGCKFIPGTPGAP